MTIGDFLSKLFFSFEGWIGLGIVGYIVYQIVTSIRNKNS